MKKQIQRLFSLCIIAALMVSFAFLMPPKAAAADTVITKILTTVQPTPVALMDPSAITVATSTEGCYIISAAWYDAAGNRVTAHSVPRPTGWRSWSAPVRVIPSATTASAI